MPHSLTPARNLLDASARALEARRRLSIEKKTLNTPKQKAFNKYLFDKANEAVAEALRAFVNDQFVDDEMERRDLMGIPEAFKAMVSAALAGPGQRHPHRYPNPSTMQRIFVSQSATGPKTKPSNWFGQKTQTFTGLKLSTQNPARYAIYGPTDMREFQAGEVINTATDSPKQVLGPVATMTNWRLAEFNTNVVTPNAVNLEPSQDVASQVFDRTPIKLKLVGVPNGYFTVPRLSLDQEIDALHFKMALLWPARRAGDRTNYSRFNFTPENLRSCFEEDDFFIAPGAGMFRSLPDDLKYEIFRRLVLFPAHEQAARVPEDNKRILEHASSLFT